jgi:hypothetical protein
VTAGATAEGRSPDWLIRPFEGTRLAPAWLGLAIAIAYPLFVSLVHAVAEVTLGPAEIPFGPVRFAWTVGVNGALFGVVLAGHAHLHLRAVSDLHELAPLLPGGDAEFARLAHDVPNLSTPTRWLAAIIGLGGGLAIATLDPTLRELYGHIPRSDPRYLLFIGQNIVFGVVGVRLFAAEVHLSRAYARLGERVEVDLLDLSKLRVFARKGLRSVVVWVIFSSTFSLFWVLDSAGQANVALPFLLLGLVLVALVAPTLGVHRSIAAAKAAELAVVADAIRSERARALAPRRADAPEDARLGNLIAYQGFVRSISEWPFDLSIVSRSALLIVLGAGSWLGGALVERLLDLLLD